MNEVNFVWWFFMMTLYLFSLDKCVNCPPTKLIVDEVARDMKIEVVEVKADNINFDLQYELLSDQVYFLSTPTIAVRDGKGKLHVITSGVVPKYEEIEKAIKRYENVTG
jgi:hypothetical protein